MDISTVPIDSTKGIKMLYVFVDIKLDATHFVDTVRHNFEAGSSLALVSTIQFVATLQVCKCFTVLNIYNVNFFFDGLLLSVLHCSFLSWHILQAREIDSGARQWHTTSSSPSFLVACSFLVRYTRVARVATRR